MKKILQDLSYEELQTLVETLGEKKFRAKQLAEGLTQGKRISDISSLSKSFKETLLNEYEDAPVDDYIPPEPPERKGELKNLEEELPFD